jgi:restriction system protein
MIWVHDQLLEADRKELLGAKACPYCGTTPLSALRERSSRGSLEDHSATSDFNVGYCPTCGWWWALHDYSSYDPTGYSTEGRARTYAGVACLERLDPQDLSLPIEDARRFLCARYENRRSVNPRVFEEVVGSVFRDLGYLAEVTSYSNDGGLDVILTDGHSRIGVQVKNTKNRIKVAQLRELLGALVQGGLTRGIFVTTSEYQSGAERSQEIALQRGYELELFDAKRFLEALRHTQRPAFTSLPEFKEACLGRRSQLHLMYSNKGH